MRKPMLYAVPVMAPIIIGSTAFADAPHDPNGWVPDARTIAGLDNTVLAGKIKSHGPLKDYARYYWGTVVNGRRVIAG